MIDTARNGGGWGGARAGQCWGTQGVCVCANGDPSARQHIDSISPEPPRLITAGHVTHRPLSIHIYIKVISACLLIPAPA